MHAFLSNRFLELGLWCRWTRVISAQANSEESSGRPTRMAAIAPVFRPPPAAAAPAMGTRLLSGSTQKPIFFRFLLVFSEACSV